MANIKIADTKNPDTRIQNYEFYRKIFRGEHFEAFKMKSPIVINQYKKLRYVFSNFGGTLSKLSADMLFMEPPKISLPNEKANKFLDAMLFANKFPTQSYESGLENSYRGDVVYRIRSDKKKRLIFEDINPSIWRPEYKESNVRKEPEAHVLSWEVELAGLKDNKGNPQKAIFEERHKKGFIENRLYIKDDSGQVTRELDPRAYLGIDPIVKTGVDDEFLIIHIPNYFTNDSFFGISDYTDLISLMYAINNRLTRVDNILDKHGDPILAVPPGILDKDGKVNKESFGVIEVDTYEGGGGMPQYIVWDAKLDSAFKQIEQDVDYLFLTSETSPAAFGRDKAGQAESGRALKFKLLRTIAKKKRKQLYFDQGFKQLLYVAQLFAKANGLSCNGVKFAGKAEIPQIEWQDGIINDELEQLEAEEKKLENSLTTTKDAISRLEGISDKDAEAKVKEIEEEKKRNAPQFGATPAFKGDQNQDNNNQNQ